MTITQVDRRTATTKMGPFGAQDELLADLPNVVRNMLKEFAAREDIPNELVISERLARKICGHDDMGSYTLNIASRLTAEISDYPFEAKYQDELDIDELDAIVEDDNCSLPTVQLSHSYFEFCTGYSGQLDSRGKGRDIFVLVMKINHDSVLVYDPYRFHHSNSEQMLPTEIPKSGFINAWLGEYEITSTLWIKGTEQRRISQFDNE